MSSPMKLSLLALVSTAAAVPHYGHSRFHRPSGGWGGPKNTTAYPHPTGTGVVPVPEEPQYTTVLETQYSTETIVSTIYLDSPTGAGYSVGAEQLYTSEFPVCGGPETVYVTATNKVTVTVPAGGDAPSSVYTPPSSIYTPPSSAAEPTSEAPVTSAVVEEPGYGVPSSVVEEISLTSFAQKPVYTLAPSSEAAPVESSAAPTSEAPVVEETPVPSVVESSVAPTPTPSTAPTTPGYSGKKRGLAYNNIELCSLLGDAEFGFAYNWASIENNELPSGAKYIPMMHKIADATPEEFQANVAAMVKKGSNAVMAFNEPDHPDQAWLTPGEACDQFPKYFDAIAAAHPEVTIIGPSVTNGVYDDAHQRPMGLPWLKEFVNTCGASITYHAANIHFYSQWDEGTVDRFIEQIKQANEITGKKVFVTEFGLNQNSAAADAATFLKAAMEYMDSSDIVEGYAYFMVDPKDGMNSLTTGDGLSETGKIYTS